MAERQRWAFSASAICGIVISQAAIAAASAATVSPAAGSVPVVSEPFESFACAPFALPPPDAFLTGPRHVYAHYFSRFPLSFENHPGSNDYYQTQYLAPLGENSKWLAQGGYLRSRPVPVQPASDAGNFRVANLQHEIRMALSRGVGGFTFDILGLDDLKPGSYLDQMLQAVQAVDPRFQIMLMLDAAALGTDPAVHERAIHAAEQYPGLARTADGRLIVSVFAAEFVPATTWSQLLDRLARDGHPVAFYPTFLSLSAAQVHDYGANAIGLGTFATPLESEAAGIHAAAQATRAAHRMFMAGIPTQGYRPKDHLFWESHASSAFRKAWEAAINEGTEAVQLTTWNDFSESTQLSPYTDGAAAPGTGFFDLNAYYATWFVTGQAPVIYRDAVYYFLRRQPVAELGPNDHGAIRNAVPSEPGVDVVELVVMLTAPADMDLAIGDDVVHRHADAGVTSLMFPLRAGQVKVMLKRNGQVTQVLVPLAVTHVSAMLAGYADLTYWSGGGVLSGPCAVSGDETGASMKLEHP